VRIELAYGERGLEVELPHDRTTVIVPAHELAAEDAFEAVRGRTSRST
jgi:hypothetical protein